MVFQTEKPDAGLGAATGRLTRSFSVWSMLSCSMLSSIHFLLLEMQLLGIGIRLRISLEAAEMLSSLLEMRDGLFVGYHFVANDCRKQIGAVIKCHGHGSHRADRAI